MSPATKLLIGLGFLEKLMVGVGYGPLLREYVYFLLAKLAFHKQHPEFNGVFKL